MGIEQIAESEDVIIEFITSNVNNTIVQGKVIGAIYRSMVIMTVSINGCRLDDSGKAIISGDLVIYRMIHEAFPVRYYLFEKTPSCKE